MTTYSAELTTAIKIFLSVCCGGVIGFEYKIKGHFAGLKTFSLVCMGSTIAMITNEYICAFLPEGGDPTKMAAQIISGIGFIGAGTIMVTNHNQVIGLSTAAALWVTASIGIAIGTGFYFCSFLSVIILLFSSYFYRTFDRRIMHYSKIICIYVVLSNKRIMNKLIDALHKKDIKILSISNEQNGIWSEGTYCAMMELNLNRWCAHDELVRELQEIEGVKYIEEESI